MPADAPTSLTCSIRMDGEPREGEAGEVTGEATGDGEGCTYCGRMESYMSSALEAVSGARARLGRRPSRGGESEKQKPHTVLQLLQLSKRKTKFPQTIAKSPFAFCSYYTYPHCSPR